MKKREMKVTNKSELSELASRRSCSQQTQQLNESKLGKFDLDESLTSIYLEYSLKSNWIRE
jgi:hypothetical protein